MSLVSKKKKKKSYHSFSLFLSFWLKLPFNKPNKLSFDVSSRLKPSAAVAAVVVVVGEVGFFIVSLDFSASFVLTSPGGR